MTTWSQQTRLTALNGAAYTWFGKGVALSADGQTGLVGSEGIGGIVFARSGITWTQQTILTDPESASLGWGDNVALSPDGRTALIEDGYTFNHIGNTWMAGERLLPADNGSGFGGSVALSADGSIALIGACSATIGANQSQGAAYFFTGVSSGPQNSILLPLIIRQ